MSTRLKLFVAGALFQTGLIATAALAQEATPGFNTLIPEWVLTPDTVETKLGTLEFFDGSPTKRLLLPR